jgi:hypothetical protein
MPAAAFALKKYFAGTVRSKTCHNEDATAALWDSEVLRVQYPPRHTIPEFIHFTDEPSEVAAFRGAE